jgi:hypothetical protein
VEHALVYALGVAVSPVAIATVLVMLSSPRGSANAVSFAAGWTVGIAVCAVGLTVVVDLLDVTDSRPVWLGVLNATVGAAFLGAAATIWLLRRPPDAPPWLDAVDGFTPVRSASLGAFLSTVNPKVFALSLGAALALGQAQVSLLKSMATVALFTVIGAAGVVVPTAAYVTLPGHGAERLAAFRRWLGHHERTVLIVLALAIGGLFLRDGLMLMT